MDSALPPEIITGILSFADNKSLFCAIQVNRLCASIGTDLLWSSSTERALQSIVPLRRQCYANKICSLLVESCPKEWHKDIDDDMVLGDLEFPKLRSLKVGPYNYGRSIGHLVQPSLRSFNWSGVTKEDILAVLASRCSNLLELQLDHGFAFRRPEHLLALFENQPSLRKIELSSDMYHLITKETIVCLASLIDLRSLHLSLPRSLDPSWHGGPEQVQYLYETVKEPFGHLEQFTCSGYTAGLSSVLANAAVPFSVALRVLSPAGPLLACIASLSNLCALSLDCHKYTNFSVAEIMELRHLTKLKSLTIQKYRQTLESEPWTEEQMTVFFSSFPELEHINLDIEANIGTTALISLTKSPKLKSIRLPGKFNLGELKGVNANFPALESLALVGLTETDLSASDIVHLLLEHASLLNDVELGTIGHQQLDLLSEVKKYFDECRTRSPDPSR
ncbi:hypothetical protein K461DRAFT_295467 [Myriangium duriaei CBS 260.36]|uniref:F-box domain-containing protein n=1 Tax=Myriangium duriaei CBS 260.36 TaxID=1168546 RepID=A0A9P4IXE8_9PEZI|nr:hypothetical protein K461DRAFT_295467 [Myriangium duriaei CBS 260.36]